MGANIVDTANGETHFKPYEVLERDGVKIVVLGMITPVSYTHLDVYKRQEYNIAELSRRARAFTE